VDASVGKREGQTLGDLEEGHLQAEAVGLVDPRIFILRPHRD
jgi:hypothetical protein